MVSKDRESLCAGGVGAESDSGIGRIGTDEVDEVDSGAWGVVVGSGGSGGVIGLVADGVVSSDEIAGVEGAGMDGLSGGVVGVESRLGASPAAFASASGTAI